MGRYLPVCKECGRASTHKPSCSRIRADIGATAVTDWDSCTDPLCEDSSNGSANGEGE